MNEFTFGVLEYMKNDLLFMNYYRDVIFMQQKAISFAGKVWEGIAYFFIQKQISLKE